MDHSFERLIRNSRVQSPFHREFTAFHREPHTPSYRDSASIAVRDSLSTSIPYRSKSYHGDLNRIKHSTVPSYYDDRRADLYRSDRSLSQSANNLNVSGSSGNLRHSLSSFHSSSYVNAYSRHHSHHNHHVPIAPRTPVPTNSRNRFHTRSAYKAYRSRSVNRLDEHDYSMPRSIRASTPRSRTCASIARYSSHDHISSAGFSSSLSDVRTIQSRINSELLRPLQRESSSILSTRTHDYSELASHILNPDIYVRWLKNKWDLEDSFRRQRSVSARSIVDSSIDYVRSRSRFRDTSFPSRSKFSYDSLRPHIPTFAKTIRGNEFFGIELI